MRRRRRATRLVAWCGTLLVVWGALVLGTARSDPVSASTDPTCLSAATPDRLDGLFAREPRGVIGADYQRATPLPDGKVLWTFQDAEVRLSSGGTRLVHNIGMVQDGVCFHVLMEGTAADPQPWLFADETTPFFRWFWPLGAEVGADGNIYVFAAEMYERGPGYLTRTEPTSTAVAIVDATTFDVRSTARPGDASASLYGFSIESDSTWTYLFAQCHRQFGFDPFFDVFIHDLSCAPRVTVARVPRGRLLATPTYWTGKGWSANPAVAAPILDTSRMVNASQFTVVNDQWMAITKVGDWWGDRIVVEHSVARSAPTRSLPTGWFRRSVPSTATPTSRAGSRRRHPANSSTGCRTTGGMASPPRCTGRRSARSRHHRSGSSPPIVARSATAGELDDARTLSPCPSIRRHTLIGGTIP